jgi:hypothetical protein
MNRLGRHILELSLVAMAGFVAFVAPAAFHPPARMPSAPLFPLVRAVVENPRLASFIGLAALGVVAGLFCRTRWYLLGLVTMAVFPLCTFAEMAADRTSHNLFPIEFIMYAIYSIPAILGAAAAQLPRPRLRTA